MGKEELISQKTIKFPKSSSFASIKTQIDNFSEKRFASKKILDSQKSKFI